MNDEFYTGYLSGNQLKAIACVTMFIDHLGASLFPEFVALRIIGRISMPLFAFTFAEGCFYTHNKTKRFLLILCLGLLTSVAMSFAVGEIEGNILITFSLSCLLIYALDGMKHSIFRKKRLKIVLYSVAFVSVLALSIWLCCYSGIYIDYGIVGVTLPVTVRLLDFRSYGAHGRLAALYAPSTVYTLFLIHLIVLALVLGSVQVFGTFALIFIMMYNGKRGRHDIKDLFYVFYPAHLAFLGGVYLIVNPMYLEMRF